MIALLLRLYPARWRARYADEFELVLMARRLGPFDVADVLLGALDAHLHLRGLGGPSQHGKGFAMTVGIGGYAAILAGVLWLAVLAANATSDDQTVESWIGTILIVATIATLMALVGLSAFQARRYPALIWAAVAVPAAGAVTALVGAVAVALNGDSDHELIGGLTPWGLASLGLLAMLAGSALFALATWHTRTLSRRAAALLVFGSLTVVPGLVGVSGGLLPPDLAPLATFGTVTLFPAGWIALGISALRNDLGERRRTDDGSEPLTAFEPTPGMRLLGLVGLVGTGLLLWAFISFNPFADLTLNRIRLVAVALAGPAISIAFYRRAGLAATPLARLTTAAVVIGGCSYAAWVIMLGGNYSPFLGTVGFVNLLVNIAVWAPSAVWAIGMLAAGTAWRGMPGRLRLLTKIGTWTLVGSIVAWMGDDRLGLVRSSWGEVWQAIALAGVAAYGLGWMLLGLVLLIGGRARPALIREAAGTSS